MISPSFLPFYQLDDDDVPSDSEAVKAKVKRYMR